MKRAVMTGRRLIGERARRVARLLALDRNPLRRRIDRIEVAVVAGLAALFLVAGPAVAIAAGQWTYHAGLSQQRAERSWHRVPAVLLRTAPQPASSFYQLPSTPVSEPARWTTPGGALRTGWVLAHAGAKAGSAVSVWVDQAGRQTYAPLRRGQLAGRVAGAEVLAPAVLAILLLTVGGLARWRLNHRRLAAWGTAWASVGPQWTRHR